MADSYSVTAILSAKDNGFTSTLKNALGTTDKLGSKLKGGLGFGVLTGVGQQTFNTIKGSIGGVISEINSSNLAWKTFKGNLEMLGKSSDEISAVKKELQTFAEKTIYSSSDMASTYAQLAAVGVDSADELVKGFGGLAAAAENPQQAMKTLSQQATQMAAKPTVAWQDFKLMLEQTPAGMAAVAKEMGMTTTELVTAVQSGKVATDKFFTAIKKAAGTGSDFEKMAMQYKSVGQAMDGLKETIGNKLTPSFEVLNQVGIKTVSGLIDKLSEVDADELAANVKGAVDTVTEFLGVAKDAFSDVGYSVKTAAKTIGEALGITNSKFSKTSALEAFKSACNSVAGAIKAVSKWITEHKDALSKVLPVLARVGAAFLLLKVAQKVVPGVSLLTKGLKALGGKAVSAIASKLSKTKKAQEAVGKSSAKSSKQILTAAKSYALMGIAVLTIALGFALLTQSAIALASAGGGAIAVMAGMTIAIAALSLGFMAMLKTVTMTPKKLTAVAIAMLAMGAAVLLISIGFAILTQASIALAAAGWGAVAVMVGMVVVIALLAVGAALLGTALTAGAVGFLAFGAALLLASVAALLAASAIQIITMCLPMLSAYGLDGSLAIIAISAALVVFGAAALVAGAGALVLGAGLLVVGVAVLVIAAGFLLLAAATVIAALGLTLFAQALPILAQSGTAGAVALALLGAAFAVFALGAAAGVLAAAGAAIAIAAFGIAMAAAAVGTLAMSAAIKGVSTNMKTIAENAKSAEKSLKAMRKSVSVVESGLSALGGKAKSAINKLKSAFNNTASEVQSAGKKVGTGFTQGMQSSLMLAPVVAMMAAATVAAALMSGGEKAYSAGAYVSQGFAQGMRSQLSAIRSAAAQMAVAADKALRAKAKIASPSKVTTKDGQWWGQGLANGILDKVQAVRHAAEKLVSIPTIATPNLANAYGGEMSADYSYYRNADYTIEVPLTVDGKEFARATATYTQSELDKQQARNSRKRGKR